MDIAGKPALVVGGSGGLGRRLVERFAEAGADIAVGWSGGEGRAAEACEAVEKHGRRAVAVRLDLRDPASVEAGVAQAAEALGGLAILMNAAGAAGGALGGRSRRLRPRNLGPYQRHQLSRPFSYLPGRRAASARRAGRHCQFRLHHRARDLGCRPGFSAHEGGSLGPNPVPRGLTGTRGARELRGAGADGKHGDEQRGAGKLCFDVARGGEAKEDHFHRRRSRTGFDLLPGGDGHWPDAGDRRWPDLPLGPRSLSRSYRGPPWARRSRSLRPY